MIDWNSATRIDGADVCVHGCSSVNCSRSYSNVTLNLCDDVDVRGVSDGASPDPERNHGSCLENVVTDAVPWQQELTSGSSNGRHEHHQQVKYQLRLQVAFGHWRQVLVC